MLSFFFKLVFILQVEGHTDRKAASKRLLPPAGSLSKCPQQQPELVRPKPKLEAKNLI